MMTLKFSKLYKLYEREIGLFEPNLIVNENIFDDLVVHDNVDVIFRNVKLFVQQIQRVYVERR